MDEANAPATKGDVASLDGKFSNLDQKVSSLDQKFDQLQAEMNHSYRDLAERISDRETRLPRAFYDFAQGNQKRLTDLEFNEGGIRNRMATIEDRLLQVERRLNMQPAT